MNAQETYQERKETIKKQIEELNSLLAAHDNGNVNWGKAGDLGYIEDELAGLIHFLRR